MSLGQTYQGLQLSGVGRHLAPPTADLSHLYVGVYESLASCLADFGVDVGLRIHQVVLQELYVLQVVNYAM